MSESTRLHTCTGEEHSAESEQHKKAVLKMANNRLATVEGHIKAIRKMLDEGRSCVDLVTQLLAVERSIRSASKLILSNHLDTCVKDAVKGGDTSEVDEMHELLELFL
ncbi:MAG: metal-sensitive transcriptional regulator [Clostridia bacterium]|nr:metal-sensitive transcriptional regulator [Clostridia bacterium]